MKSSGITKPLFPRTLGILLILCTLVVNGQVRERFPNESGQMITSGYPAITGFSRGDSDSAFHAGIDAFLLSKLKYTFHELGHRIDATCQLLITVENGHVSEVEIIETPSMLYARQVEALLFELPIDEKFTKTLVTSHQTARMTGCCEEGKITPQPLHRSAEASSAIGRIAIKHEMWTNDSIRWLIQTDGIGTAECIALNPHAPAEWNDLLLSHLDTIISTLPGESNQWIVGYYPRDLEKEYEFVWRQNIFNTLMTRVDWQRSLNQWLRHYDCPPFHPDQQADDSISSVTNGFPGELTSGLDEGDRFLLIVDPQDQGVLCGVLIKDHEISQLVSIPGDIRNKELHKNCHNDAPIIVELLP